MMGQDAIDNADADMRIQLPGMREACKNVHNAILLTFFFVLANILHRVLVLLIIKSIYYL